MQCLQQTEQTRGVTRIAYSCAILDIISYVSAPFLMRDVAHDNNRNGSGKFKTSYQTSCVFNTSVLRLRDKDAPNSPRMETRHTGMMWHQKVSLWNRKSDTVKKVNIETHVVAAFKYGVTHQMLYIPVLKGSGSRKSHPQESMRRKLGSVVR